MVFLRASRAQLPIHSHLLLHRIAPDQTGTMLTMRLVLPPPPSRLTNSQKLIHWMQNLALLPQIEVISVATFML